MAKSRSVKMLVVPAEKGRKDMGLTYKGLKVINSSLRRNGEYYDATVGIGGVRNLQINVGEMQDMRLRKEKNGKLYLYVRGITLTKEDWSMKINYNDKPGPIEYRPTFKKSYLMDDNRFDIYAGGVGGWYKESHNRQAIFHDSLFYLKLRLASGLPTKKPYVLQIEEMKYGEPTGRKWNVKLEITKG